MVEQNEELTEQEQVDVGVYVALRAKPAETIKWIFQESCGKHKKDPTEIAAGILRLDDRAKVKKLVEKEQKKW